MARAITLTQRQWSHLTTFMAEGLVLIATVLVYKLAANRLGEAGFESYTIVRRTTSFLQTIAMCGMAVAIVRHVAMAATKGRQVGLLRVAVRRIAGVSLGLVLVSGILPGPLSTLFFGTSDQAPLILPIAIMASGLLFHTLAHGYLRGNGLANRSNLLQALNIAIVPNLAMLATDELRSVLWATGSVWVLVSWAVLARSLFAAPAVPDREDAARMVRFGTLRLPGDVVFASLLSLPVFLVNHIDGMSTGAGLAFAITMVNVAGAAYSPLSLILLPSVASLMAHKQWAVLRQRIQRVSWFVAGSAMVLVLLFELLATPLLRAYLGPVGTQMEPMVRLVFIGAGSYGLYVALRSVLDAYHNAPRNTFNLFGAFAALLVVATVYTWVLPAWWFAAMLVIVPLTVLGWSTWRDVRWVLLDLRSRQADGSGSRVLEPVPRSSESANNTMAVAGWERIAVKDGGGLSGAFARASALRRQERHFHPEYIVVRRDPASVLLYTVMLRAPLVFVSGPVVGPLDRCASLVALRVICPTEAAMERLRGWATSVRHGGTMDEKEILSILMEEENPRLQ